MAGTASPRSSPPPAAAAWLLWGLFCLFCALDWGFASVYSALLALRVTALVIDETMSSHHTGVLSSSDPNAPVNGKMSQLYLTSAKELDRMFQSMLPCFEDRETEQNWKRREQSVNELRRLCQSNAPADYHTHFAAGIKTVLDGILKTVKSLRTTLSSTGCELVKELTKVLGPSIDSMVDIILPTLIELCGHTKTLNRKNGDEAITAIVKYATCNSRLLHYISSACHDKNVPPRVFAAGWLTTAMKKHGHQCEHGGGLDTIDKCIRTGLQDAKPEVREAMRATYWTFARLWPDRAESIMSSLDAKAQKSLESDASNPANKSSKFTTKIGKGEGLSKSSTARASNSSLREAMLAQKRALKTTKDNVDQDASRPTSSLELSRPETLAVSQPESIFSKSTTSVPARSSVKDAILAQKRAMKATAESQKTQHQPPSRPTSALEMSKEASETQTFAEPANTKTTNTVPPKSSFEPSLPKATSITQAKSSAKDAMLAQKRAMKTAEAQRVTGRSQTQPAIASEIETQSHKRPIRAAHEHQRTASQELARPGSSSTSSAKSITGEPSEPAGTNATPAPGRSLLSSAPIRRPRPPVPIAISKQDSRVPEPRHPMSTPMVKQEARPLAPTPSVKEGPRSAIPTSMSKKDFHLLSATPAPKGKAEHRRGNSTAQNKESKPRGRESEPSKRPQTTDGIFEKTNGDIKDISNNSAVPKTPRKRRSQESSDMQPPILADATEILAIPATFVESPLRGLGKENEGDAMTHKRSWQNKEIAEKRRSISPRSKDPEEARKMMARAIEKIKSRSIDDHGYRKLQGLIQFHDLIFEDEQKYDDMLLALLEALETPNTEKRVPLGRRYDNKFQILVTIRLMYVHNRKYFAAYYPRAMSAIITARRNFESRNHIVSGLEETAQDITSTCNPPDVIDSVLDVLETEERDDSGSRTIAMGLHILSGLSARMRALEATLDSQQELRMARFGLGCLRERNSVVRRAVIEYCLELRRTIKPEERFFRLVTGDVEDLKNLITYYVANGSN